MKFTEEMLSIFAAPLSKTEDEQCQNAIQMVVNAIKPLGFTETKAKIEPLFTDTYAYSQELRSNTGGRNVKIFIQGSYANNTNVRTHSDVDIAIMEEDVFRTKYREGVSDSNYNFSTAPTRTITFKDEVERALKLKFGEDVERKNKSIKINGNSYRKDSDGVPCMRHRDYRGDITINADNYVGGIYIKPDNGDIIINYPEQHIKNGKEKNVQTNRYYKKMTRIMKKMRYLMQEKGIMSADNVSSFALESLLWNIPNSIYLNNASYRKVYMFNEIINYLKKNKHLIVTYYEANGIKSLCDTPDDFYKYIDDLSLFYEYE